MSVAAATAIRGKHEQLRHSLFGDVPAADLWDRRTSKGFATVPRALPLLLTLMDQLSINKPVSGVYLALWCRAWDDPLVAIGSKIHDIAVESGFTGRRAHHSLTARLAVLKQLGLVKFAPGTSGEFAYALLINPYRALAAHRSRFAPGLWNALLERMAEIGADDLAGRTEAPIAPVP